MGLQIRVKKDNQMLPRHKGGLRDQMDGIFGFKS